MDLNAEGRLHSSWDGGGIFAWEEEGRVKKGTKAERRTREEQVRMRLVAFLLRDGEEERLC